MIKTSKIQDFPVTQEIRLRAYVKADLDYKDPALKDRDLETKYIGEEVVAEYLNAPEKINIQTMQVMYKPHSQLCVSASGRGTYIFIKLHEAWEIAWILGYAEIDKDFSEKVSNLQDIRDLIK